MSYFTLTVLLHLKHPFKTFALRRLGKLYGMEWADRLLDRMYQMIGRYGVGVGLSPNSQSNSLSQQDVVLITYADMVQSMDRAPYVLREFCSQYLKGAVSTIHLPLFTRGHLMMDFQWLIIGRFIKTMGNGWISKIFPKEFQLMFDLVLNHCSAKSPWFKEFVSGVEPGMNYIKEADAESDLSAVVRPRSTPLLTPYQTRNGEKMVWTTFSADQVDLDWTCPDHFLRIFGYYSSVIFPWVAEYCVSRCSGLSLKRLGTNCLHLPETHEVIKLIRNFVDVVAPETILLTETNVPHEENIS